MKEVMDDIAYAALLIYKYIDNELLAKYYQENINISIEIIENNVFLYSDVGNTKNITKKELKIDFRDINLIYKKIYELLKNTYLESQNIKIGLLKTINLSNVNKPYLIFRIKDIHRNEINLFFKDYGLEKDTLNEIEEDWLNIVEEKKSNRKK